MKFEPLINLIESKNLGEYKENVKIAEYTSIKVGGIVKLMYFPESINSLIEILNFLREKKYKFKILGRGSNIIFSDHFMEIVIIKIGDSFSDLNENLDGTITIGAGYSLQKLSKTMSKKGLSGLEFAGGIPGTVGGAVYMNAGAHTNSISEIVESIVFLNQDLELEKLKCENAKFEYRKSIFHQNKGIILEVILKFKEQDAAVTFKKMSGNLEYRKEMQPLNWPSFGSVFKNPQGYHAGKLIEEVGLKGYKIGGAEISTKHANFIVNKGSATAKDILELIELVKKVVYEKKKIKMITEVEVFLGENDG